MNKMTKRLLACCCALPMYAVACDGAGETVWVKLQLTAAQQTPVEWPLLQGHLKANTICIDKKLLAPQYMPTAALPVFLYPLTDLTITLDQSSEDDRHGIKAQWQLDVYGVAGLSTVIKQGKSYQPSCVLQHLDFNEAKASHNAGRLVLDAQVQVPALGECQGVDAVRQAANAIPAQWSLDASFILLDSKRGITGKQQQPAVEESKDTVDSQEEKPSILEQFINMPPADEDAKKRMKKR